MRICLLGAPSSAGAYAPGQERAPAALRAAGLVAALGEAGFEVEDLGDVAGFRWRLDREHPRAMNAPFVRRAAEQVAAALRPAMAAAETRALVIGGDCTVEIGTVAAAAATGPDFGLIYVDMDADLNTPESTSDGAFDWMGVAHMLGIDGIERSIVDGIGPAPLLRPEQLLYFGTGNVEPFERERIAAMGIEEIPIGDVRRDPEGAARRAVDWAAGFGRLLVHLDVDVLDYADFPIAENVRRGLGLSYGELMAALGVILAAPNLRALTVAEVNPDHCEDPVGQIGRLVGDLVERLGR